MHRDRWPLRGQTLRDEAACPEALSDPVSFLLAVLYFNAGGAPWLVARQPTSRPRLILLEAQK